MLDNIDKAIIRVLINNKDRFLNTMQIATKAGVAPLTAKRHLEKLEGNGYVTQKIVGGIRKYEIENG